MNNKILIIGLILILVVAGGGIWWWQSQAEAASSDAPLEATGVIEARRVTLASETGGQVVEVLVEEGQRVRAGQPLVRLDDALLVTQRAQAEAALRAAQAKLALLKAGATAEQIKAAEAQLAQAQAGLQAAQANLDALTAGSRPEEIQAVYRYLQRARSRYLEMTAVLTSDQIEKVRSAVTTAESNLSAAMARRDDLKEDTRNPAYAIAAAEAAVANAQAALEVARAAYTATRKKTQPTHRQIELARLSWEVAQANLALAQARRDGLVDDERTTPEALDAAEATLRDAQAQVDGAKAAYDALTSGISALQLDAAWEEVQRALTSLTALAATPQADPGTPIEALLSQIDAAMAQRDLAAANLEALKRGARTEGIDAAQAQVAAAQAQLDALDVQLDKFTIAAPWDGVVLHRSVEPGETVMPGATMLEIGRLDQLELTVYLPEDRFGLVTPGQPAAIRVDAYPDRVFTGTVLRIADEAEFTPTNVQTKEDRSRLVYAVALGLDNPDLALKPGMIADATFSQ